jgi:nicotinic acid mononucleotide adenylyltransferase
VEVEFERLRRLARDVGVSPLPAARLIRPASATARSIAALPGAFNPPTLAHLELARAAATRGFEAVLFSLGTRTIDKEEPLGLSMEERLHLLEGMTAAEERLGVLVQNRGLYVDQIQAIRSAFPSLVDLAFVVGIDKIEAIFDPRYYDDFAAALARLFSGARLVVASRDGRDRTSLERLLDRPEARAHAGRIEWLELGERWQALSATRVRERLARGEVPEEWLAQNVARYLAGRLAAFTSSDRRA